MTLSSGSEAADVIVVGAGIHGATVALFLARGGMRVALYDRGAICREASGVNAGTLTMQMTRVALIPYALKGHEMWRTAPQWLGHDVGFVGTDGLSLAFTEHEAEILQTRARLRREAGAPIAIVSTERARQIEPDLSERPLMAAHCPVDGYTAAYLTGRAYRAALAEAGVALHEHTPIEAVTPTGDGYEVRRADGSTATARRIVFAGGVWIEPMLAWLGVRLPIKTLVNQLAVTERLPPVMRTVIGIASGLLSLKQFPNGSVVIGGGWQGIGDRESGGHTLHPDRLVGNVRLACHAIPALARGRLARAWAGLEAETADAMPAVGEVPGFEGAFVCGSVHSGYTSGLYIARLLADRILGREPEMPLFPIDRLLGAGPSDEGAAPRPHAGAHS
jgi:glycine/D-amino acid oxidase-like deaminating enzyme